MNTTSSMNDLLKQMNSLLDKLSNKPKLIPIATYKSHIKISNLEMPPPIITRNLNSDLNYYKRKSIETEENLKRRQKKLLIAGDYYKKSNLESSIVAATEPIFDLIKNSARSSSLNALGSTYTKLDELYLENDSTIMATVQKKARKSRKQLINDGHANGGYHTDHDTYEEFHSGSNDLCMNMLDKIAPHLSHSMDSLIDDRAAAAAVVHKNEAQSKIVDNDEKRERIPLGRKSSFIVEHPSPLLTKNLYELLANQMNSDEAAKKSDVIEIVKPKASQKQHGKSHESLIHSLANIRNNTAKPNDPGLVIYSKLGALVKGYLVRRLLKTERVHHLIAIIRDTTQFAIKFQNESPIKSGHVTNTDIALIDRIIAQLQSALQEISTIFFKTSIIDRMEIIDQDRKVKQAAHLKLLREQFNKENQSHEMPVKQQQQQATSRRSEPPSHDNHLPNSANKQQFTEYSSKKSNNNINNAHATRSNSCRNFIKPEKNQNAYLKRQKSATGGKQQQNVQPKNNGPVLQRKTVSKNHDISAPLAIQVNPNKAIKKHDVDLATHFHRSRIDNQEQYASAAATAAIQKDVIIRPVQSNISPKFSSK